MAIQVLSTSSTCQVILIDRDASDVVDIVISSAIRVSAYRIPRSELGEVMERTAEMKEAKDERDSNSMCRHSDS